MALRTDWSDRACPIARSLDVLGDPWSLLILREVFLGNHRFDTIRDRLDVADTVLSRRLNAMVEDELLNRVAYAGAARPRYDYTLTDAGRDALPVLHALARWGTTHRPRTPRMKISCTTCGQESLSADWCSTCQAALTVDNTAWRTPARPKETVALSSS
jgi:DNA-binding HxlR family transcriptional regulator